LTNMDKNYISEVLKIASVLRKEWINVEVYPDNVKIGKQFKFADAKGYNFVWIIGESEKENWTVSLKNMKEGTQEEISISELIKKFSH
jgi:histidyl-tRNA synthetase